MRKPDRIAFIGWCVVTALYVAPTVFAQTTDPTSPVFADKDTVVTLYSSPTVLPTPQDSFKTDTFMTKTTTAVAPTDSLEIVGVGISVETWRNHPDYPKNNLWTAVEQSKGTYIISDDPKKYPKDLSQWQMMAGKRNGDMKEIAMWEFVDRYPLPIAVVSGDLPASSKQSDKEVERVRRANAATFVTRKWDAHYTAAGGFPGLLTQAGQVMNSYLNDNPDKLWQVLFTTFDEHLDLPAVGIGAADDVIYRALPFEKIDPAKFAKLSGDAYRPKHARILSDSQTMLALVRRGRIDWLRPYADLVLDHMTVAHRPGGPSRNWSEFEDWLHTPSQPFVPTPFIAKPWTRFQIDQFDHLEILGRVHRPQVVSYLDEHGKQVSKKERQTRMEAALRAVLAPLGGKMPVRLFYDYNSLQDERNVTALRWLPFFGAMWAVDSEWDLHDPSLSYNLTQILGDLGAGSPFVSVAMATMAGLQSGGATLIANLRRDDGATLLLVTPPTVEERKHDAAIKRPFWPGPYARVRKL